jgi:simple sugar transport system ATP-binding protein
MSENYQALVKMINIHKSFGKVVALKGVNFEMGHNEIVGLLGDNGAGKSTLVKILMGVFPPSGGEIRVCGEIYFLAGKLQISWGLSKQPKKKKKRIK